MAPVWVMVSEVEIQLLATVITFIARTYTHHLHSDVDGIRAVGHAYAMLHAQCLGKCGLEVLDALATDEGSILQHVLNRGIQLHTVVQVLALERRVS